MLPKQDELAGIDLKAEMELIRQKRSMLSRRLRMLVEQRLNEQFIKENAQIVAETVDVTS